MSLLKFEYDAVKAVITACADNHELNEGKVRLVNEDGVYLMAYMGRVTDGVLANRVAYAQGCNPNKDKEYMQTSTELAGVTEFVEEIPLSKLMTIDSHISMRKDRRLWFTAYVDLDDAGFLRSVSVSGLVEEM